MAHLIILIPPFEEHGLTFIFLGNHQFFHEIEKLAVIRIGLVPPWLNLFLEICLTAVARTSNPMLNRSGGGHPCLICEFSEGLQLYY